MTGYGRRQQQRERERAEQQRPEHVDAAVLVGRHLPAPQAAHGAHEHQDEQRDVDPEDRAPVEHRDEQRARRRPDHGRGRPHDGVGGEGVALEVARQVGRPEHERHRQQEAAAEALQEAPGGDLLHARRRSADHRADREDRATGEQRAQRPDAVVDGARERQPDHAGDRIGAGGERVVVEPADVARRARQRRDDDQQVERRQEARPEPGQHERAVLVVEQLAQRTARGARSLDEQGSRLDACDGAVRANRESRRLTREEEPPVAAADPDARALERLDAAARRGRAPRRCRASGPGAGRRGSGAARWRRRARERPRRRAGRRAARRAGSGWPSCSRRTRDQRPSASSDASPTTVRFGRGTPTEPSKASAQPRSLDARIAARMPCGQAVLEQLVLLAHGAQGSAWARGPVPARVLAGGQMTLAASATWPTASGPPHDESGPTVGISWCSGLPLGVHPSVHALSDDSTPERADIPSQAVSRHGWRFRHA